MWRGIDAALLDYETITWQGMAEHVLTRRAVIAALVVSAGAVLVLRHLG